MRTVIQLFTVLFSLTMCGQTSTRVGLIEKHSDIKLPRDFKVLQDKSKSSGKNGERLLETVELEFDSLNFNDLLKSIPKKSQQWREDGGNLYYSKGPTKGESIEIIIDPASRLLLFRFNH